MKQIQLKITKDGKVNITSVVGFGSNCLSATSAMEARLGSVDPSSRKHTAEMYDVETQQEATQTDAN